MITKVTHSFWIKSKHLVPQKQMSKTLENVSEIGNQYTKLIVD